MNNKYIVIDDGDVISMIIFSSHINHRDIFYGIKKTNLNCKAISAGFIQRKTSYCNDIYCYGESQSLKIKSNPKQDNALLDQILNERI